MPRPMQYQIWGETWTAPEQWLLRLESGIRSDGGVPLRGGVFDAWDLEVLGGMLGSCRIRMAVEEHGGGRQLFRFRSWPHPAPLVLFIVLFLAAGAVDEALNQVRLAGGFLAFAAAFVGFHALRQYGAAMAVVDRVIRRYQEAESVTAPEREVSPALRVPRERDVLPPTQAHLERAL